MCGGTVMGISLPLQLGLTEINIGDSCYADLQLTQCADSSSTIVKRENLYSFETPFKLYTAKLMNLISNVDQEWIKNQAPRSGYDAKGNCILRSIIEAL